MNYCVKCGKEVETKIIEKKERFVIYGEPIDIDTHVLICDNCGNELFDEKLDEESLQKAYETYRNIHMFLHPKEIKEIREQYGLSQRGFAKLLNWGDKTIFRYENGSLQDKVHDSFLKLLRDPENMKKYLEENELTISKKMKDRVLERITQGSDLNPIADQSESFSPSIYTGYKMFDYEKYCAMIRFFVDRNKNMLKVKLLKLMNYADMLFFAENGVSISGSRYIHFQYGPVPENYNTLFERMVSDGYLIIEEELVGEYTGYHFSPGKNKIESVLSDEEKTLLDKVDRKFKNFGSSEITEYSHREEGYIKTEMNDYISYSFAENIELV